MPELVSPYMTSRLLPRVEGRKTDNWVILSKSQDAPLGSVHWYSAWRQYVFEPGDATIFNAGCLESIRKFLEEANRELHAFRSGKQKGIA